MNDCECDILGGGWCARHNIEKPAHWVHLCRTKPKYWQAWEEGRGPGQPNGNATGRPVAACGVSTEELLRKIHGIGDQSRSLDDVFRLLDKCRACATFDAERDICSEDKGCGARRVFAIRLLRRDCQGWDGPWPAGGPAPSPIGRCQNGRCG